MKLINLTPHPITILSDGGSISIAPADKPVRCTVSTIRVGTINFEGVEIPLTSSKFGKVEGLPDPQPDTFLIVSRVVAEALPEREDLLIPNESVRDQEGRIIGVRSLSSLSKKFLEVRK